MSNTKITNEQEKALADALGKIKKCGRTRAKTLEIDYKDYLAQVKVSG